MGLETQGRDISSGWFCKQFLLIPGSIPWLRDNPVPVSDVKEQLGLLVFKSLLKDENSWGLSGLILSLIQGSVSSPLIDDHV